MRPVQKFSKEYLELCQNMKQEEIVKFLEGFRLVNAARADFGRGALGKTKLISMKVEHHLLEAFKEQCRLFGVPYQTQIKRLMAEWLTAKAGVIRQKD
jgi:predicted DNA binding CopG/RHH family protein